jgi:hypothetical protein
MGNFALQTGPYNFLNLRISPWESSSVLLLSSSLSCRLLPFFSFSHRQRLHSNAFSLPPFPCSASGPPVKRGTPAPATAGGAAQGSTRQALGEAAAGAGGRRGRLGARAGRVRQRGGSGVDSRS